ncbi:MAG: hypothetical protein ACK5Z2_01365 [Bacteroidota bacterium]|jgi:hypothetical protein
MLIPFDVNQKESASCFWIREGRVFTIENEKYFEWKNEKWQSISEDEFWTQINRVKPNYASQGKQLLFKHKPTSGVEIYNDVPDGTFIIGSFDADLKYFIRETGYTEINKIDFKFPVPVGEIFNLLNIGMDEYNYWSGRGVFFTNVNGPWVDAAEICE